MRKKRLFVLSIDAMVYEDLEYIKTLPNMKRVYDFGTRVEKVRTVYPSLTYPCHVSMATGCYPDKHGVYNNELVQLDKKYADWWWYAKYQQVENIFDVAKAAGYTTAAFNWPVMAGSKSIDWLVSEIWLHEPYTDLRALLRENGANDAMMQVIENNLHYLDGSSPPNHPSFDNFAMGCCTDIMEKFTPEVCFAHDARIDGARHNGGVFSDLVLKAYDELDEWVGKIFLAMEKNGVLDQTDIVFTSDHGQMNYMRKLSLNKKLAQDGYITLDMQGNIICYTAFVKSAGLSSQVHIAEDADEKIKDKIFEYLCTLRDSGIYGFDEILTKAQAKQRYHLEGDFEFVLEGDGYTALYDNADFTEPLSMPIDTSDYKYMRATHGHMPEKGPQPTIMFAGPSIKSGVVIKNGRIIDQAPTYAKLLGTVLPQADGNPIDAVLL